MIKIVTEADYRAALLRINQLLEKGSQKITLEEMSEITYLTQSACQYERKKYDFSLAFKQANSDA